MKGIAKAGVGFIAAMAIALCVMSWFVAGKLTDPKNGPVIMPADIAGQTLRMTTADNVHLAATFLPGRRTMACVLVLHGNGGNRSNLSDVILALKGAGYGVMTIDFRGHGESDATRTTAGYVERLDVDAAFAAMQAKCPKRKTAIYGFSLGGAAALLGSSAAHTDALVLEAVYTDIASAVAVRVRRAAGEAGNRIVTPVLMRALELRTGISRANMRPLDAASQVTAPVLLLAGGKDDRAPASGMREIQARLRGKTQLIVVPDADHGSIAARMGPHFAPTLLDFLHRSL